MSNFHGNLSRLSLVIQEVGAGVVLPGWASAINRSRLGRPSGFISNAVDKTATPPPVWLLDVKAPDETISREFIHTMGRYPSRNNESYRYEMDHIVDGRVSQVAWRVDAFGLCRREYWTQKPGDGRYYVNIEYMDGSTWSSGEHYLYKTWVGTDRGPWQHTASNIVGGKAIRKITLGFIAELKSNSYHDVGDRSPGWGWNTDVVIAGQLSNAGFNAAIAPLERLQDIRTDRLRKYEGKYGSPTVAPVASESVPPVRIRISKYTPPSIWSSIKLSGYYPGALRSPNRDIYIGSENGRRDDTTDDRTLYGWSDIGPYSWNRWEGIFMNVKKHRDGWQDGFKDVYITPSRLRGVIQIRNGGNVTDRTSGSLVRTFKPNERSPRPFDVPAGVNWIMWVENSRGY